MSADPFARFKEAQADTYAGFEVARRELSDGRKSRHWIWYLLPQLAGLGSSSQARAFGLAGVPDAVAYLADPVLGPRYAELVGIVATHARLGADLRRVMGSEIDTLKLVSSLTLFERAAQAADGGDAVDSTQLLRDIATVLAAAEAQGYPRCARTLAVIADRASG